MWWRKKGLEIFSARKARPGAKGDELPYPRAGTTSLLNQVRDAVLQNKEAETSGRDNFSTLAMVAAAVRSAEQARQVSVSELVDFIAPENGDLVLQRGRQQQLIAGREK